MRAKSELSTSGGALEFQFNCKHGDRKLQSERLSRVASRHHSYRDPVTSFRPNESLTNLGNAVQNPLTLKET